MPRYNPEIHHRRSIRLRGYNYSKKGLYFLTICTKNRKSLFGYIENNKMVLNTAGEITKQCWIDIPKHYPNTKLHQYVIMPNHVHGIIEIIVGANNHLPLQGTSKTIGAIVRGFKIGVTKWFRQNHVDEYPIGTSVWQRNYWEHIIRNEKSYNNIIEYIKNNPSNWTQDKLYR